jgi:hypothetical protein
MPFPELAVAGQMDGMLNSLDQGLSAAHTQKDIERALDAAEHGFRAARSVAAANA